MRSTEILLTVEMLNAKRKGYKLQAAAALAEHVGVWAHCHNCACNAQLPSGRFLVDT